MKYNLGYLFDLLVVITNKDLKVRYKSSVFGYLWSIANPLLFAMIYYFIFKLVMRVQIPNYTLFLITGLFPWQWFASSATNSLFSFIANAQIIKKTVFPRSVIPLSNVMMEGLHFFMYHSCDYCISVRLRHAPIAVVAMGYSNYSYWSGYFHVWYLDNFLNTQSVFSRFRAVC
ncbi:O-antigen export system permease protein RfbD [Raoultella terrigena]|uniref:O-antigen export system permease protein RfbD n=1 Tax=Raoultella terrigena TaxID=577 RepID=A0A7Z9CRH3_RAOTE|nr:O-antigen export system permease protein RfbD [Raoultella terrigena]